MRRIKIIFNITLILLLLTILCGCNESNTNNVIVTDYGIETFFKNCGTCTEYSQIGFYRNTEDGKYNDYPSYFSLHTKITGKIKNNAGKKLDTVYITAIFYDEDNNELIQKETVVNDLANSYEKVFFIDVDYYDYKDYYTYIDHVDFQITSN